MRATARLLGVVYHSLMFRMFAGGSPPGPMSMGGAGADRFFQDWLHSFRMPLFFLISGFFGRMMLEKYGMAQYLRKRWLRIGIPLVVGMFTFGPAYVLTREAISPGPGPGGGPPRGGAFGPRRGELPPPPPGVVPPPLVRFDADADGSLSNAEWKKARTALDHAFGAGGPAPGLGCGGPGGGFRPGGPRPGPFRASGGGLSGKLFGSSERLFHLNHL